MAKDTMVGISCSHGRLTLAYMRGGVIKKCVWADIPENVIEHGELISGNLLAALIKETMRANGISAKKAAFVFSSSNIFVRNLIVPKMSEEQIRYNIPFEFRDFIQGELKDFIFDYAWRPPLPDEEDDGTTVKLLAVAMKRSLLGEITAVLKLAGLKLVRAIPDICAFESLLKLLPTDEERMKERCFFDIGNSSSRMLIYKNGRYKLTHMVDMGERRIVQVIADEMNVDMHIAKTYLVQNYEQCGELPACVNCYKDISVEVLKGLNFYEISDMSARLSDVVLCGGGAMIKPLVEMLKKRIMMNVNLMGELFPEKDVSDNISITGVAVGALL
ncbi:MAG: pilus assembly protein PilM [Lachnospiraceae bacterium]|nr:pilus assembly protein PilM [Lachnospiraceae bacterium]